METRALSRGLAEPNVDGMGPNDPQVSPPAL